MQRVKSAKADLDADVEAAIDSRNARIAANLAKLDASSSQANAARSVPLRWNGYAWRTFMNVKNTVLGEEDLHRMSMGGSTVPSFASSSGSSSTSVGNNSNNAVSSTASLSTSSTSSSGTAATSLAVPLSSTSLSSLPGGGKDEKIPLAIPADEEDGVDKNRPKGFKQTIVVGIRRKSIRVLIPLLLFLVVMGFSLVLLFSAAYGTYYTRDPCVVSHEQRLMLKSHPRKSKLHPDFKPVLPKIVHQQWKNSTIPEGPYTVWHNKFLKLFPEPEYTHMIWTDESARKLIETDYPFFLRAYDSYEFGIQRADAARYFFLHKYGGLYADLDYEPLVNFWDHLPTDRVALVESPYQYNEKAQNSLMSSPKGDPFWEETFKLLEAKKDRPVLHATGPMFLDALMKTATEDYTLLPCENFQRLPLHLTQEEEVSPFMSQLHRELLGRLAPMKHCGDYHHDDSTSCQYGKHHNTASYLTDTGVMALLWT